MNLHIKDNKVESVTVDMLEPKLEDDTQFLPHHGVDKGTFVSMGNPHYVIFTDDVDQVGEAGRILEHHPAFPQRCNIEFARVEPDGSIRTRVWERGSGITQACGTGACAAVVASCLNGYCPKNEDIRVILKGGDLIIRYTDDAVFMTGNCERVFTGEMEI